MADSQDETMETVAAALDLDVDAVKEMYGYYDFSNRDHRRRQRRFPEDS